MKKILTSILLLTTLITTQAATLQLKDITDNQYKSKNIPDFYALDDDEHYLIADPTNTCILRGQLRTGTITDTLLNLNHITGEKPQQFDAFAISKNARTLLIHHNTQPIYRRSYQADYYIYPIGSNQLTPLYTHGKQQNATLSPDGNHVAFIHENNIYIHHVQDGSITTVTTDGKKNQIINGIPDWVYEEEFAISTALAWAPDATTLSYIRFDETEVPQYQFTLYEGHCPQYPQYTLYPGEFRYKYPCPGCQNSKVSVRTYQLADSTTRTIQLPLENDSYIPRIQYTTQPDQLAIITLNRKQNDLRIHLANPQTGNSRQIIREQTDNWHDYDAIAEITLFDNFIVLPSRRSGYRHLYQYDLNGKQLRQLTHGNWNVTQFLGYNPKSRLFYFQSTQEGPIYRNICHVNTRGKITPISRYKGVNNASFSPRCTYFLNRFSNSRTPMLVTLCNADGKTLRILESNDEISQRLSDTPIPQQEYFTCPNDAGDQLNGFMIKPLDFDPQQQYPVVMVQYSGPASQLVLDEWKIDWYHYLATQGFIIACVDGRGTGGRSTAFETCVYLNLGKYETQDQIAAARYMASLPYVDPQRIGIWGWSYGGYETLMAMTHSQAYRAGVSIAPVTDWQYYNSIYTERYMHTPQENPEGYFQSSPIHSADQLSGALLIISGTADDNVHYQNTLQMASALVEAGKQFDMQIYPNKNHSILGCQVRLHLYTKVCDFFTRQLKE